MQEWAKEQFLLCIFNLVSNKIFVKSIDFSKASSYSFRLLAWPSQSPSSYRQANKLQFSSHSPFPNKLKHFSASSFQKTTTQYDQLHTMTFSVVQGIQNECPLYRPNKEFLKTSQGILDQIWLDSMEQHDWDIL